MVRSTFAAAQLALDHEPPNVPALRPADQQVGPASAESVLPLDDPASVHHPLQMRLEQELRARLLIPLDALNPVLRALPEEGLEVGNQPLHVQGAVGVHVPGPLVRQARLHSAFRWRGTTPA